MKHVSVKPKELDQTRSIPSQLYEILRSEILDGTLAPGERLVEQGVANAFAVSRTPVREVFHRLEADGLIEQSVSGLRVVLVEPTDVVEILAVRQQLERMASGLAASYRTELEAARFRHLKEKLEAATKRNDSAQLRVLARELHSLIGEASRNQYLARLLSELRDLFDRAQGSAVGGRRRQVHGLSEHLTLIDAIVNRDVAEAERVASVHWSNVTEERTRMLWSTNGDR
jgi:DNA-binding GntR family transcriptional regulator